MKARKAALVTLMTSRDGTASLAALAMAEGVDLSGGPPYPAGHEVFKLVADLSARGVEQVGPADGLLGTRFRIVGALQPSIGGGR